ncbi:hypothetical protein [Lacrimispora indolis]|uniref:hypothetical protein n=1 Tax=Lacrimispora indolis TaxID=69825 RepID=UPI00045EA141|nr:hypothetical protein [Lacrimispora indolis]
MSMKSKNVAALITMAALFVSALPMTALANEVSPHLFYGTERTYGEDTTRHEDLILSEFGEELTGRCAVLPKNDTFSIEKEGSDLDPSHELVLSLYCPSTSDSNGQTRLFWEEGMLAKTERLELGKEYSLYNDEVKAMIADLQGTSHVNDPFIVIYVTDIDINYSWRWIAHLTDNWSAPNAGSGSVAQSGAVTQKWASDGNGWWIQNSDGTYLKDTWYQSPESGLWYYMGSDGYMLVNTTTPDGSYVNQSGVWVQ